MAELWDPWQISAGAFPRNGSSSEKLRFLLNYAILAPSSHNTQPWLFRIIDDGIELYADRTRALPVVDPDDRELTISCGAALFNLRIALRHFGYEASARYFPDPGKPDLFARIKFGTAKKVTAEENALFDAIVKRRTNRMPFGTEPIQEHLLAELREAATTEGAWFVIVAGEPSRNKLADLIAEADHKQMSDGHFRRELAAWIHPNRTASHDGTPAYALGVGSLTGYFGPLVVRTFDVGKGRAAKDRQLAAGSPALAVLGTKTDTVPDWLSTGQALARILLRAREDDVWASFLNQPIEIPKLRTSVSKLVDKKGFPQLILRMGHGGDVKPTPRRTPGEVLMRERVR